MRVAVIHGSVKYEGQRYEAGDKLDITDRYFGANPGRFEDITAGEQQVLNAKAEEEALAAAKAAGVPPPPATKKARAKK